MVDRRARSAIAIPAELQCADRGRPLRLEGRLFDRDEDLRRPAFLVGEAEGRRQLAKVLYLKAASANLSADLLVPDEHCSRGSESQPVRKRRYDRDPDETQPKSGKGHLDIRLSVRLMFRHGSLPWIRSVLSALLPHLDHPDRAEI